MGETRRRHDGGAKATADIGDLEHGTHSLAAPPPGDRPPGASITVFVSRTGVRSPRRPRKLRGRRPSGLADSEGTDPQMGGALSPYQRHARHRASHPAGASLTPHLASRQSFRRAPRSRGLLEALSGPEGRLAVDTTAAPCRNRRSSRPLPSSTPSRTWPCSQASGLGRALPTRQEGGPRRR